MEELVRRAQAGDAEAMEAIWTKVERFACAITRRYRPTAAADADDFRQCAYLGTRAAVMEAGGKHSLLSLISWNVRCECRRLLGLRRRTPPPDCCSLDALCPDGETAFAELLPDDSLPDHAEGLSQKQLGHDVREAVSALRERERRVIISHYFRELNLADVAQEEGVTYQRVQQIEAAAFLKLRMDPRLREDYACIRESSSKQTHTGSAPTEQQALDNIENEKRQAFEAWVKERLACGAISQETARALLS